MQRLPRRLSRHPPPATARATPGPDALQRCRQVPPAEVASVGAARAPLPALAPALALSAAPAMTEAGAGAAAVAGGESGSQKVA